MNGDISKMTRLEPDLYIYSPFASRRLPSIKQKYMIALLEYQLDKIDSCRALGNVIGSCRFENTM